MNRSPHWKRTTLRRAAAAAAIVVVGTIGATASVAQAEDFGNWATGCAPGWTCFYEGATGGTAMASTTRDSNFSNNPNYPGGTPMNNHVHGIANKFTGTTKVQAYQGNNYVTATGPCLSPGYTASPYASDNVSSFKSC